MRRALNWIILAFAAIYIFALAIFVIGTFGLFGADTDPLSGVFLIPIGLPWNRFFDALPEASWPWLTAAAPVVNLLILLGLRRLTPQRAL